jgi:hypothetical protein
MAFLPSLRVAADVKASGPESLTSGEAAIEKGIITRLESCRDRDLTRRSDMSNTGSVVRTRCHGLVTHYYLRKTLNCSLL